MLTFHIDKDKRLIIEKYSGITRIGTVEKLMHHIWNHPNYEKDYDRIVDFLDCSLIFSREEFQQFKKAISENANSMRGRAAVLVKEPGSAAIVTMYEDQMNHLHKIGVFCYESEVANFLNLDSTVFDKTEKPDAVTITIEE